MKFVRSKNFQYFVGESSSSLDSFRGCEVCKLGKSKNGFDFEISPRKTFTTRLKLYQQKLSCGRKELGYKLLLIQSFFLLRTFLSAAKVFTAVNTSAISFSSYPEVISSLPQKLQVAKTRQTILGEVEKLSPREVAQSFVVVKVQVGRIKF